MDLSSQFRHASTSSTLFSPDGEYALSCSGDRIVLRLASTLAIERTWKSTSSTPSLAFSSCSRRFLACHEAIKTVIAYATDSTDEIARITAGPEGCRGATWLDEVSIAVWSEHGVRWTSIRTQVEKLTLAQLRVTIWSLATGLSKVIQWPLLSPDRGALDSPALHCLASTVKCTGWALRPSDSRYFALVERHDGRDAIGIYDGAQQWSLVRHFGIATADCRGLAWSPCSRYLAVWDSPLEVRFRLC